MSNEPAHLHSRPRRVLCCSGSLDGGGSERQLWQLASGLDRRRFEPHVHLLYRRGTYLSQLPVDVPVHAVDEPRPSLLYWPGRMHMLQIQDLCRTIGHQSIGVVYDRTYHMTLVTAPACRRTACPRVSAIVSPPSRDMQHRGERFLPFKRMLLGKAYADPASLVLAVSQAVADDAEVYYRLRPGRVRVVPSPVDVESVVRQAQQPNPLASEPSIAAPRLRVAIIARMTPEKGHHDLLSAVHIVKQQRPEFRVHLDVIGDGPLRTELETFANLHNLGESVHFHGFQMNPYRWMRLADIVCVPSLYEGLPNVALEAMALGTPLLMTACNASIVDLLGSGQERGVWTPPGDATELARHLTELIDAPEPWRRRAEVAADWVRQRHSLQAWLQTMADILDEAGGRGQVSRRGRRR